MITQVDVRGSAPQACGARIIVTIEKVSGTIGGGQLEHSAVELARQWLSTGSGPRRYLDSVELGSRLGQCCGGRVRLLYEVLDHSDLAWLDTLRDAANEGAEFACFNLTDDADQRRGHESDSSPSMPADAAALLSGDLLYERLIDPRSPLFVFGAGHVAQALVPRLGGLPFSVRWVDSREDVCPEPPGGVDIAPVELGADPFYEINKAPRGSFYLILTHSHAEDFEILQAVLARGDAAWVGLIGSETKWRGFANRLEARGVSRQRIASVHCPIGLSGITGKQPQVIAASVVAQLLLIQAPAVFRPIGSAASELHEEETYCDV